MRLPTNLPEVLPNKTRTRVQCLECGNKFSTSNMLPICLNCGGSDIDLADAFIPTASRFESADWNAARSFPAVQS